MNKRLSQEQRCAYTYMSIWNFIRTWTVIFWNELCTSLLNSALLHVFTELCTFDSLHFIIPSAATVAERCACCIHLWVKHLTREKDLIHQDVHVWSWMNHVVCYLGVLNWTTLLTFFMTGSQLQSRSFRSQLRTLSAE